MADHPHIHVRGLSRNSGNRCHGDGGVATGTGRCDAKGPHVHAWGAFRLEIWRPADTLLKLLSIGLFTALEAHRSAMAGAI